MERKYYLRGLGIGIIVTAILMGVFLSADKGMTDEEVIARAKKLGMTEAGAAVLSDTDTAEADTENSDNQDEEASQQNTPEEDLSDIEKILAEADAAGNDSQSGGETESGLPNSMVGDGTTGNSAAEDRVPDDEESGEDEPDTEAMGAAGPKEEPGGADSENESEEAAPEEETTPKGEADTEEEEKSGNNSAITSAQIRTISIVSGDGSYSVAKKLADAGIVLSAETFDTFLCQNGYDKKIRTGTFSIPADASDEQIARIVTGME